MDRTQLRSPLIATSPSTVHGADLACPPNPQETEREDQRGRFKHGPSCGSDCWSPDEARRDLRWDARSPRATDDGSYSKAPQGDSCRDSAHQEKKHSDPRQDIKFLPTASKIQSQANRPLTPNAPAKLRCADTASKPPWASRVPPA